MKAYDLPIVNVIDKVASIIGDKQTFYRGREEQNYYHFTIGDVSVSNEDSIYYGDNGNIDAAGKCMKIIYNGSIVFEVKGSNVTSFNEGPWSEGIYGLYDLIKDSKKIEGAGRIMASLYGKMNHLVDVENTKIWEKNLSKDGFEISYIGDSQFGSNSADIDNLIIKCNKDTVFEIRDNEVNVCKPGPWLVRFYEMYSSAIQLGKN